MAVRPAWSVSEKGRILKENFKFEFNPGFSPTQKKKNVKALHEAIGHKALEVSTKSNDNLGLMLSAFKLKLDGKTFENVFQASKKYENGGPFTDLLCVTPKEAKKAERHHSSGKLISFVYNGEEFKLEPKTFFYDFMYIKAVQQTISKEDIQKILTYEYFTDIEFNPQKSINCQAKSVAIIKAILMKFGYIPDLNKEDFSAFYSTIKANLV